MRHLIASHLASSLPERALPVLLATTLLSEDAGPTALGLVYAVQAVGFIGALACSGVWVFRLGARRALVVSNLGRGAALGALAAMILLDTTLRLTALPCIVLFGAADGLSRPALVTMVADVTEDRALERMNSLMTLTRNAAFIIGPASAALSVEIAGAAPSYLAGAALFVAAVALLPAGGEAGRRRVRNSFLSDLRDGFNYVRPKRRPWFAPAVAAFAVYGLSVAASVNVLGPIVARDHFNDIATWGALATAIGVGTCVGSFVGIAVRSRRPLRLSGACMIVAALQPLVLATSMSLPTTCLLLGLSASAVPIMLITWQSNLQRAIPASLLSRVSAVDYLCTYAPLPIGLLIVGPVANAAGVSATLQLLTIVGAIAGLTLLLIPSLHTVQASLDQSRTPPTGLTAGHPEHGA